jgi:hypothetical protein
MGKQGTPINGQLTENLTYSMIGDYILKGQNNAILTQKLN